MAKKKVKFKKTPKNLKKLVKKKKAKKKAVKVIDKIEVPSMEIALTCKPKRPTIKGLQEEIRCLKDLLVREKGWTEEERDAVILKHGKLLDKISIAKELFDQEIIMDEYSHLLVSVLSNEHLVKCAIKIEKEDLLRNLPLISAGQRSKIYPLLPQYIRVKGPIVDVVKIDDVVGLIDAKRFKSAGEYIDFLESKLAQAKKDKEWSDERGYPTHQRPDEDIKHEENNVQAGS